MALRLNHDSDDLVESHEINVTPFIDVILVLLIIFMVAAPLMTTDVKVDLPASTAPQQARPDRPVFVTIKADHSLALGDDALGDGALGNGAGARERLGAAIDRQTHGDKAARIFLRADKTVDYDSLMQVMNALRAAGYLKVALVGLDQSK